MERLRMDRVNAILKHKTYRKYYDQIEKIEKEAERRGKKAVIASDASSAGCGEDRLYHESGAESGV